MPLMPVALSRYLLNEKKKGKMQECCVSYKNNIKSHLMCDTKGSRK